MEVEGGPESNRVMYKDDTKGKLRTSGRDVVSQKYDRSSSSVSTNSNLQYLFF